VSLDDLTNQLTGLKDSGTPDLQLSPAGRDRYLKAISTYRDVLAAQKQAALDQFGDVSSYGSAHQLKSAFVDDAHGPQGLDGVLDHYIAYLDELSATITAACNRVIAEDGK
jgi:hypothetical protein